MKANEIFWGLLSVEGWQWLLGKRGGGVIKHGYSSHGTSAQAWPQKSRHRLQHPSPALNNAPMLTNAHHAHQPPLTLSHSNLICSDLSNQVARLQN